MTSTNAGLTSSSTGSSLKSRKILAVANSPNVPLAFSVMTSGTSFFTSRVRSAVSGSAGLSTTTRMSGFSLLELARRGPGSSPAASPLNWKNTSVVRRRPPEHDESTPTTRRPRRPGSGTQQAASAPRTEQVGGRLSVAAPAGDRVSRDTAAPEWCDEEYLFNQNEINHRNRRCDKGHAPRAEPVSHDAAEPHPQRAARRARPRRHPSPAGARPGVPRRPRPGAEPVRRLDVAGRPIAGARRHRLREQLDEVASVGRPRQILSAVPSARHVVGVKLTADTAYGVACNMLGDVEGTARAAPPRAGRRRGAGRRRP